MSGAPPPRAGGSVLIGYGFASGPARTAALILRRPDSDRARMRMQGRSGMKPMGQDQIRRSRSQIGLTMQCGMNLQKTRI
jgi:hypothetical protein